MIKQRHIGYTVFGICSAISARLAFFEPRPHVKTAAEERWGYVPKDTDPLNLVHDFRVYIYLAGSIGLLMVIEDYFTERAKMKKMPNPSLRPTVEGK